MLDLSGLRTEIQTVHSVSENEGKIRVTIKISFQWTDSRLRLFNIWKSTLLSSNYTTPFGLNSLRQEEVEAIWTPQIQYLNSELDHFEVLSNPAIRLHLRNNFTGTNSNGSTGPSNIWYMAEISNLHNAYVIDGRNIWLDWSTKIR
jgi:hypothetical protein